jgi:hypothetical protein
MPYHSIGQPGSPAVEFFRKHGLTPFRRVLSDDLFSALGQDDPHPNAVLIPSVVFWLMAAAALSDGTLSAAVISFWTCVGAVCPAIRLKSVTEEAFCTARRRLPLKFFRGLFDALVKQQEAAHAERWRWRGKRLLGIDGTLLQLPRDARLRQRYSPARNERGAAKHPQALLVGLVGLWSGLCYSFTLVPQAQAEQWCACWLTRYLHRHDLLLADRNFASYEIIARVLNRRADFLFRLPCKRFHKLRRNRANSGRSDEWLVDLKLPAKLRKRCPHLSAVMTVRILEYQIPGYRVSWLITSLLDTQAFWNQETIHREWKHTLQLSNLRSHSPQGILKEVFVQMTLNNAIRAIQADALPYDGKPTMLQFLNTKRLIMAEIPTMAMARIEELPSIYATLLCVIAMQTILVRSGRSYPRPNDGKIRNKGHGRLVPSARLTGPVKAAQCNV